jgi:hypothetical protein
MSSVTAGLLGPVGGGIANVVVGCVGSRSSGNCGRLAAAEALEIGAQFVAVPGGGGTNGVWGTALSTVEAGVLGGIEARISGGSFNNGFSNAAGSYLGTTIGGAIVSAATKPASQTANANAHEIGSPADPSQYTEQEPDDVKALKAADPQIDSIEASNWDKSMQSVWIDGKWTHREYGLIVVWNEDTDQYTNITRVGTFQGDQPYVNLGYEPASDDEFVVYVSHTHPLYIPESALGLLACSMVLVCGAGVPSTADVQLMLKYHPGAYGEVQSADGKNYYLGFGISH